MQSITAISAVDYGKLQNCKDKDKNKGQDGPRQ